MSSTKIDRRRVAELTVTRPDGRNRGSGYRITETSVLTAAHVLEGAESVRIRFEPDLPTEWTVISTSWCTAWGSDLAVIEISSRAGESPLEPTQFGRISSKAAVLNVQAVGFPRWKLRSGNTPSGTQDWYRDSHQAVGTVAVLSNWREGTLEVTLPSGPPGTQEDANSPWEGMSGAALWAGQVIIGVISKHHNYDGLNRLAAERIDSFLDNQEDRSREKLRQRLSLPARSSDLPDVSPTSTAEITTSAYQAQLADIAPNRLLDRDQELEDLVRFCAGNETYAWWQAGPWAGKSALLAWFALNPPAGVDVVTFFITSRFAGQSDSDAFIESSIEQLAALCGESPRISLEGLARSGHFLRLLQEAAKRSVASGRILLIVIDGLDEDTGRSSDPERPSIASLLPRRPPAGVRVLAASRPSPELPDDVAVDHPLRTLKINQLSVSPHARNIEITAKSELTRLLRGSVFQRDVLGLITASGGGLTQRDLEELSGRPLYELDILFDSAFGRTLAVRTFGHQPNLIESTYLFAHDTLRIIAEQQYGASLKDYRDRIHAWAQNYQSRNWPPETPMYLLRGYPRLLAATDDFPRLLRCATSAARHNLILDVTGGDALSLSEISSAQSMASRVQSPDLGTCIRLAALRDQLLHRNRDIPAELAIAWAELGEAARAEALSRSISSRAEQDQALAGVAHAAACAGEYDRSMALASDISNASLKVSALAGVAHVMATSGQSVDAEALARGMAKSSNRDTIWARIVRAVSDSGQYEKAEELANHIVNSHHRQAVLTNVAQRIAETSESDRAEALTRRILGANPNEDILISLARGIISTGNNERAKELLHEAEAMARSKVGPVRRPSTFAEIALLLIRIGDQESGQRLLSEGEAVADRINDPENKDSALRRLSITLASAAEFSAAEEIYQDISQLHKKARALIEIAQHAIDKGAVSRAQKMLSEAQNIATRIDLPHIRESILLSAADGFSKAGMSEQAKAAALSLAQVNQRSRALALVAANLARASEIEDAQEIAQRINDPNESGRAFSNIARTLIESGRTAEARSLLYATERLTRGTIDVGRQAQGLAGIAAAMAITGRYDEANRIAKRIHHPYDKGRALADLAQLSFASGEMDHCRRFLSSAESLLLSIRNQEWRGQALAGFARVVAAVGLHDQSEAIAKKIASERWRSSALAGVAEAFASSGSYRRGEMIARRITSSRWRSFALAGLADILATKGYLDKAHELIAELKDAAYRSNESGTRAAIISRLTKAVASTGDYEQAKELAFRISATKNERYTALAWLVESMAFAGNYKEAEDVCASIKAPHWQGKAAASIAKALATSGKFDEAEKLAQQISNPDMRARALVGISEQIARITKAPPSRPDSAQKTKDAELAKRLIADALIVGDWTKVVRVTARVAPESFLGTWKELEEYLH